MSSCSARRGWRHRAGRDRHVSGACRLLRLRQGLRRRHLRVVGAAAWPGWPSVAVGFRLRLALSGGVCACHGHILSMHSHTHRVLKAISAQGHLILESWARALGACVLPPAARSHSPGRHSSLVQPTSRPCLDFLCQTCLDKVFYPELEQPSRSRSPPRPPPTASSDGSISPTHLEGSTQRTAVFLVADAE